MWLRDKASARQPQAARLTVAMEGKVSMFPPIAPSSRVSCLSRSLLMVIPA